MHRTRPNDELGFGCILAEYQFQTRAAGFLGLHRDQIRYRIEKFKLEKPSAT